MATSYILLPIPGEFDDTAPPGIAYTVNLPRVLFDDTTPEIMYWQFRLPGNYASGPVLKCQYTMSSATSGTVEFEASIWAISDGDSADVDTESYDTVNTGSATVPGTAGYLDEISITMTNADSMAAGDLVRLQLARDADDGTNDTATGDLELRVLSLEYTTT